MSNMDRAHQFYGDLIADLEIAEAQAEHNNWKNLRQDVKMILEYLYSQKQTSNRLLPATRELDADTRIIDAQWRIEGMTNVQDIMKTLRLNIENAYQAANKQHRIMDARDSLGFFQFGARARLREETRVHHGREYQCVVQAIAAAEQIRKFVW